MGTNTIHTDIDDTLLERLSRGNQKAFADIYLHYHEGIYNYLLKFTKNPVATEDLVHDVFLKIWEAREQLTITSSFSSYLYRVARNSAINQLKRISTLSDVKEEILHRVSIGISDHTLINDIQWAQYEALLKKAIASLPQQRRDAFRLCREHGKSYEEAAAIMGISKNTLKQHLVLAVKSIKSYLLEHGDIALMLAFITLI